MPAKNQLHATDQQPTLDVEAPPRWDFGNLLDADARNELREFYGALESSKNCKTILVGFTLPLD